MGGKPVQSHYPALFSRISGPLCSLKALTRATPTRLLLAAHKPHASELVVGNERILAVVLLADSLRKSLIVDEHSYLIILGPSSDLWEGAITRWSLPMLQLVLHRALHPLGVTGNLRGTFQRLIRCATGKRLEF